MVVVDIVEPVHLLWCGIAKRVLREGVGEGVVCVAGSVTEEGAGEVGFVGELGERRRLVKSREGSEGDGAMRCEN